VKAVGIESRPTVHDLRRCWKSNAMRSGVHLARADAILGHGNKKESLQSLYLTISDRDLLDAIDRTKFRKENRMVVRSVNSHVQHVALRSPPSGGQQGLPSEGPS
jgi:hypothetical protein